MPGSSDVVRVSKTIRAFLIVSLVVGIGLSVETIGAPWELRIDIPGATSQGVRGISSNRQYAVGFYRTQQGHFNFVWHAGKLSTISIPGADGTGTALTGINARGDVIGVASFGTTGTGMTFLRGRDGTITPISCPSPTRIEAAAINNARTVVGSWENLDETRSAFRWRDGWCEVLPIHDGRAHATDISDSGIIIGSAGSRDEFEPFYSFMIKGAEMVTVEHPEARFANGGLTALTDVASNGLVLGWSSPSINTAVRGDLRWFVYRDGVFESIAIPVLPRSFNPLSISPSGVITYQDTDDVVRTLQATRALTQF